MFKIILSAAIIGAAAWFLPGPTAEAAAWLERQAGYTASACSLAPESCFEAKARNYRATIERLGHVRGQVEAGSAALDAEQWRLTTLDATNQGLQQALRQKAQAMLQSGTAGLDFQGRHYNRPEVEQQASLLTTESEFYRARLAGFPGEHLRLTEVQNVVIVYSDKLASLLATLDAERALVMATGSAVMAKELFASADALAGEANQLVKTSAIRATSELHPADAPPASAFDFDAWLGRSAPAAH